MMYKGGTAMKKQGNNRSFLTGLILFALIFLISLDPIWTYANNEEKSEGDTEPEGKINQITNLKYQSKFS